MEVCAATTASETRSNRTATGCSTFRGRRSVSDSKSCSIARSWSPQSPEPLSGIVLDEKYYHSDIRIPHRGHREATPRWTRGFAGNFKRSTPCAGRRPLARSRPDTPLAIVQFRARATWSRSHQPTRIPLWPAICRLADRRIHRAGRRQRQGRSRPERCPRPGAVSFTASRAPFGDPRGLLLARTTTSLTRSS